MCQGDTELSHIKGQRKGLFYFLETEPPEPHPPQILSKSPKLSEKPAPDGGRGGKILRAWKLLRHINRFPAKNICRPGAETDVCRSRPPNAHLNICFRTCAGIVPLPGLPTQQGTCKPTAEKPPHLLMFQRLARVERTCGSLPWGYTELLRRLSGFCRERMQGVNPLWSPLAA